MKSHIVIGLLAMSFLTTLPVPAQAFDVMGGINTSFPDVDAQSSPPWADSLPSSSDSSPIYGNSHHIDTTPTPHSPNVLGNPHHIDVTPDQPGQAGQPSTGKPAGGIRVGGGSYEPGVRLMADCAVAGTPAEFPNDIVITNTGSADIPAGTKIAWRTSAPTVAGSALVAKTLKAGRSATLNNVLSGGLEAGTACTVTAIRA